MTDLKKRVQEDRGLIKNIQLAIPGFRGYRKREDIRSSDSLLRAQIADQLHDDVAVVLEESRKSLAESLDFSLLKEIGRLIQIEKTIEARIRHAEQGYSGISPNYRIEEDELNALYQYDWNLIQHVKDLVAITSDLSKNIKDGNINEATNGCITLTNKFDIIDELLEDRMEKMSNQEVN